MLNGSGAYPILTNSPKSHNPMKRVNYRLADSNQIVQAICLWEEKRTALLFVPPVGSTRGSTLVIAERRTDWSFEDSTANTFPIEDWSASMICVYLMLLVKENAINEPIEFN